MNKKILCLLILFPMLQLNSAEEEELRELRSQLARTKSSVQSIKNGILSVKDDLRFSTNSKMSLLSRQAAEQVEKILQQTLNHVMYKTFAPDYTITATCKEETDKLLYSITQYAINLIHIFTNNVDVQDKRSARTARAKGTEAKTIEKYVDNAKAAIGNARARSSDAFAKCNDDAIKSLDIHMRALTDVINVGNNLISDIDSIFPQCSYGNILKIQNCVPLRSRTVNYLSQVFENDAGKITLAAQEGGIAIVSTQAACNAGVVSLTKTESYQLRYQAIICLH